MMPQSDIEPSPGDEGGANRVGPPMHKVLIIAHAFPPTGGPGVQRPAKFAKYLPSFGWKPMVWSADYVEGLPRDETLSDDLPESVSLYTRSPGGVQALRRTLRGFRDAHQNGAGRRPVSTGFAAGRGPVLTGFAGAGSATLSAASNLAAAVDWRVAAWCTAHGFPDDCAGWARRSIRPLIDLVRREGIDLIFSTYSPASNHLLALELQRRTRLPWVAEFRDLWVDDGRYRVASSQKRDAHLRLQQEILEKADAVIGVSPRQTAILSAYVPKQRIKFHTITNGFDPDDFTTASSSDAGSSRATPGRRSRASRTFVLAHVGRFDLVRTRDELFEAFRSFSEQIATQRSRFLVRIVGHANAAAREKLLATGLPCEFVGYVSHRDAIAAMRDADALLLPVPDTNNGDTIICGKLFEYLASQRPIVVIGPRDGECERIVRSCRAGLAVPFETDLIISALQEVYDAWRAGRSLRGCPEELLGQFARPELTRRLAGIFEKLAGRARTASAKPRTGIPIGVS